MFTTSTILEALIHQSFPPIDPRRENKDLFKRSVESRKLRGGRGSLYMGQGRTEGLHTFPTPLGAVHLSLRQGFGFLPLFRIYQRREKKIKLRTGTTGMHGQLQG